MSMGEDAREAMLMASVERNSMFRASLRGTTWHTNDGRILDVSEMTPNHAGNALEWLVRERSMWASEAIIRESVLGRALAARAKEEA